MKKAIEELSKNGLLYQRLFLLLSILLLVFEFLKFNMLILVFIILLISFIFFYLTKGYVKKVKQLKVFGYTLAICVSAIMIHFVMKLPILGNMVSMIIFVIIFGSTLIYLNPSRKNQELLGKFESIVNRKALSGVSGGLSNGDTMMGVIKGTNEPNLIPYKDRFLHTLIIGPTGSGKTSTSLIPMAHRDLDYKDCGVIILEPKGDFAEKVAADAILKGREQDLVYFNPKLDNCPYFNPMMGSENDAVNNIADAFASLGKEKQAYFRDLNERTIKSAIKVAKRVYGNDATLEHVNIILNNINNEGQEMLDTLSQMPVDDPYILNENKELISWFKSDYYTQLLGGGRDATKTYEQAAGARNQLSRLLSNRRLKKILCPPKTSELDPTEYINFDAILEKGGILSMCSGRSVLGTETGKYLGMFLILSLESAIFRRPGDENTRRGIFFYVDEFQQYANEGYTQLLTEGRSYRVASILATQSRSGIKLNSGGDFGNILVDVVSTNCRNKLIYPGCSYEDAEYYSKEFGSYEDVEKKTSLSKGIGIHGLGLADRRESISEDKKKKELFTPSDIMYSYTNKDSVEDERDIFFEVTSKVIQYNNPGIPARKCIMSWISKKENDLIEHYVNKYFRPHELSISEVTETSLYNFQSRRELEDYGNDYTESTYKDKNESGYLQADSPVEDSEIEDDLNDGFQL